MTTLFLLYLRIKSSYMKKLFFTLLIILSLCNSGFAQSAIDPRLQEILSLRNDEMIPINIILKSQIDITKLKTRTNVTLDKNVRRNILVDEFKIFAEEQQQEVLSILQAETRSYKVSDIRQNWLANAISCNADRNVIYLLSEHPDIEIIGIDEMTKMIFDEDMSLAQADDDDDELYLTDNIFMVNADKVWKKGYTGKGVIVAVIDSGVNYKHEDLKDHLWDGGAQYPYHGYNFIDDNNNPMDDYGHGTHCAGTVCGDGTAGINTGIAPDATLMCLKALNNKGTGNVSSISNAMQFAIENHADIINMSLGIPGPSVTDKTMLRRICDNALELGVIASVAAGNYGNKTDLYQIPNNILAPADCPPPWLHPDQQVNKGGLSCVVSVGAVDWWEKIYEGSSQGPVTWTNTEYNDYPYGGGSIGLIRPDICAPGVGIKSLDHNNNNNYNLKSGTSMAAPCVAGVMALMLEKYPNLTPAEICEKLETTAKKLTETKSNLFGSGLIDAYAALFGNDDIDDDEDENEEPAITIFNVTITINPANAGTVTGEGSYEKDEHITLTATPNEGYKFINWTENEQVVSEESKYSFTIISHVNLVANFEPLDKPEEPGTGDEDDNEQPEQPGESVEELTTSFNIFPNPANDKLYIETEVEIEEVVVYTITGVIAGQQSTVNSQQSTIDVADLSDGIYFVKIVTDNGDIVKRFVKQ